MICIAAPPKRSFVRKPSPKQLPAILPRPRLTTWQLTGGGGQATTLSGVRPSRRQPPISAKQSRWRTRSMQHLSPRTPRILEPTVKAAYRLRARGNGAEGICCRRNECGLCASARVHGRWRNAAVRLISYYADCLKSFMRGEHRKALQIAEIFLREAEGEGRATEAGVARRILGLVLLQMGDAAAAQPPSNGRSANSIGSGIERRCICSAMTTK